MVNCRKKLRAALQYRRDPSRWLAQNKATFDSTCIDSLPKAAELPLVESKTTDPLVSIVTVVYNGRKGIEKTITSVLAQTYKNIEYLIIDGGSEDGTVDIIKKYSGSIAFWNSQKDGGIYDAMNKGITHSKGCFLGFCNSGDWLEKNAVELLMKSYKANEKADILLGDIQYWNNDKRYYVFKQRINMIGQELCINHPATLVKRTMLLDEGGFNTFYRLIADIDFFFKALKLRNAKYLYVEEITSNMQLEGATSSSWMEAYFELLLLRLIYGYSFSKTVTRYLYQILRTLTRMQMEKRGLSKIVRAYRKKYSDKRAE